MVSKEEVKQIAEMCKLKLSQEETDIFIAMFSNVLEQVEKLNTVDTDGVEALNFLNLKEKSLREDIVEDSLNREEVLKNAPEQEYGYFKLLRVMD
ncbi:Asp-tRNA(Asn)/Glu-tRNA(Gln) amidotransferase subunit GatC [Clostridium sp. Cult1]|uniref:Asp-tRNA(Asn)/Glu-tRNA(Gln) amidotransferase subunit GatC n=1 Tax=Clostridium sp. Cult1 TaxID=2079002 RepID=UPI001F01BFBC|nr:Asp-tRNA(Asn)/Glu-tRNA(Gln) amidotransferase subunit GatC [Clostridium sp. Cult1]MCF6462941.1 Asp-tRNA(Asn)/Glu-tRNA(Gln) amidotransferase subunit GatC [Clostridium sp. Cult1]